MNKYFLYFFIFVFNELRMNLLRIKIKSEENGISIRSLSDKIGMSEQNLHRCIREGRIEAGALEKIAAVLEIPISYFFDKVETPAKKDNKLDEMIDLQRKYIAVLEEKLEEYEGRAHKRVG